MIGSVRPRKIRVAASIPTKTSAAMDDLDLEDPAFLAAANLLEAAEAHAVREPDDAEEVLALDGDFDQAVALLAEPMKRRAPAGFAQRSEAVTSYARTIKENQKLRAETADLKQKLENLTRRPYTWLCFDPQTQMRRPLLPRHACPADLSGESTVLRDILVCWSCDGAWCIDIGC